MFRPILVILFSLLAAGTAWAGGHFDIDDAGTLDPGQCQYEIWGGRFGADPSTSTLHFGPACGVGPVELGLNFERDAANGDHAFAVGPQIKWNFYGREPDAKLSAAVFLSAAFDVDHGGKTGGQFALPVSWNPIEPLWINFNLGYDWLPVTGTRSGRGGLQGDWTLNDKVSLIAERFRSFGLWSTRAGVRWSLTPLISIDTSVARSDGTWGFAVGLNHEFKGF